MKSDSYYMRCALKEAQKAYDKNEIAVGAVIVYNDKIIARGHNLRETKSNSLAHAEIIAINKACKKLGDWRLEDCILYVTIEPCIMCSGAIIQSRIKKVVYGATNPRFGTHQSITNIFDVKFNHQVEVQSGILSDECSTLIKQSFANIREK